MFVLRLYIGSAGRSKINDWFNGGGFRRCRCSGFEHSFPGKSGVAVMVWQDVCGRLREVVTGFLQDPPCGGFSASVPVAV